MRLGNRRLRLSALLLALMEVARRSATDEARPRSARSRPLRPVVDLPVPLQPLHGPDSRNAVRRPAPLRLRPRTPTLGSPQKTRNVRHLVVYFGRLRIPLG